VSSLSEKKGMWFPPPCKATKDKASNHACIETDYYRVPIYQPTHNKPKLKEKMENSLMFQHFYLTCKHTGHKSEIGKARSILTNCTS
jgi:CRISPR/Cas system-associated protein Csx1